MAKENGGPMFPVTQPAQSVPDTLDGYVEFYGCSYRDYAMVHIIAAIISNAELCASITKAAGSENRTRGVVSAAETIVDEIIERR